MRGVRVAANTRGLQGKVLVVAGEVSGDRAAARVVDALRGRGVDGFFGMGGAAMAEAGVEVLARTEAMAAIGLFPALRRGREWLDAWARLRERILRERPRVALLVDSPDSNLPLARILVAAGTRVVYYIGPQVWAWRGWRLRLLRSRTHHVALVLPFEKPLYDRAGVAASFVGHPILDEAPTVPRERLRAMLHAGERTPVVALLPGSRASEVEALAPAMIEAGLRLVRRGIRPVFAPAPGVDRAVSSRAAGLGCALLPDGARARDLLSACDAALVTSGTATLEAAVEGAPMAVVYKLGPLSWEVARRLVNVEHIALPNILAKEAVVPELLQDDVTAEALERAALALLDPATASTQRAKLARVASSLGGPGAATRTAGLVARELEIAARA